MNVVSALLRLACGLVILILTWTSWGKNKAGIAAGEPVQLFGQTVNASSGSITLAYGLIAVLGLGLLLLGVMGLMRGKK